MEKDIIITTGDIKEDYEILDVIFASEKIKFLHPDEKESDRVLSAIKEKLKKKCKSLNGDAIVNCHIYQFTGNGNILSASGTIVRMKNK